jgi:ferredoxin
MAQPAPRDTKSHEQHRVLTIRGKSYCNSACIFCIEKFAGYHPVAPKSDETRQLILQGAGKYNMLFFMNGEPSVHPKLFEYVELAKQGGFKYFGMSSHFRAFADPYFALKILEAGFEFFDISLHAASYQGQIEVNPIGDAGRSLKEALHGLRNITEIARRTGRRVGVTHKFVITRLNYRELLPLFRSTYDLGVRNFIMQPVKASGLQPDVAAKLAINEDEFMPYVNDLLRQTEGMGAEIKLYGMSQLGVYDSKDIVQESNLIKHVFSKRNLRLGLDLYRGDKIIPEELGPSDAPVHSITVQLPESSPAGELPPGVPRSASFECREDQVILNAALRSGLGLPFGCRMGSCGMCCGKVVQGSVERLDQLILTPEQMAEGYTLLCRSKPKSDCVIITHQEYELGI